MRARVWTGVVLAVLAAEAPRKARAQDEAEPLPAPLPLHHVVELARSRRAEVRAYRARARAAAQRPAIVSALEDPMISPSVDHLPFTLDGVDLSLDVEQRFPLSGVLGDRRRAAEAEAQRAGADVERATLDVALEAARAFVMLREVREMARILGEQRRLAESLVSSALARYGAGNGSQPEVLRAQIEVARFDAMLQASASEIRAAEAMLNTSIARPPSAPIPALAGTSTSAVPPSVEAVRAAALARRPELSAGRAEIARAEAEIEVMESMYAPMAMVRTGPAYTMEAGAGWMLMIGISIPIWRGRLGAGVAEAEAMAEMARADLEAMRRMVEGDAVAARQQVVAARDRALALERDVIPRARSAIAPSLAGYAAGQLPLVSVLEAAQALWSAEAELVSAEASLGLAWARLDRAVGGEGGRRP